MECCNAAKTSTEIRWVYESRGMRKRNKLILNRDAATNKTRVFTSVDIGFHSVIAAFYLFLPQFCHSEIGEPLYWIERSIRLPDRRNLDLVQDSLVEIQSRR